ncbi:hypothetical protein RRG08_063638, partial [Elysia crispata]
QPINRSTGRAEQADMEPQIDKPTASRPDLTSPLCSTAHLPTMLLFHRLRKQNSKTVLADPTPYWPLWSVQDPVFVLRTSLSDLTTSKRHLPPTTSLDLGAQE